MASRACSESPARIASRMRACSGSPRSKRMLRPRERSERGRQRAVDRLGHLPQDRVPGGAHDRAMEGHVRVVVELLAGRVGARALCGEAHPLERVGKRLLRLPEWPARPRVPPASTSRIRRHSRYSRSTSAARGPPSSAREHVGVERGPSCVLGRDDRAAAVPDRHQPALLEPAQAFARHASAHAEPLSDVRLARQELTLGVAAGRDVADDHPHRTSVKARHTMS